MEKFSPVCDARKNFGRICGDWEKLRGGVFERHGGLRERSNFRSEHLDVAAFDCGVDEHVFNEDGDFAFFFAKSRDGEAFFCASKRDVKEAALFLNVKLLGGLAFFHESGGKF